MSTSTDVPIASEQTAAVPFHLSLNVANLDCSVEFFRKLFDLGPAKRQSDYAKFEVANPPLVLSLEPFEASAASTAPSAESFPLLTACAICEAESTS